MYIEPNLRELPSILGGYCQYVHKGMIGNVFDLGIELDLSKNDKLDSWSEASG